MGLVPGDGAVSTDGGVTFRRQSKVLEPTLIRRVKDIKPINQPRKARRISAPETVAPGIIIDKNGKVVSMDRGQFNRMDTAESNTADLFVKYRKYQQAFSKVNSEKSFRKLLENMGNDIEFRLAMEENPGLLRQEMIDAAARIGLMGRNRKSLLSDNNLVFKKGGILKAQPGTKFNLDFKPTTFAGKTAGFTFDPSLKVDILDPNYKPIQSTAERVTSNAMFGTIPTKGTIYDAFGKASNPASDALSQYGVRSAEEQISDAKAAAELANPSGARPTGQGGGFN